MLSRCAETNTSSQLTQQTLQRYKRGDRMIWENYSEKGVCVWVCKLCIQQKWFRKDKTSWKLRGFIFHKTNLANLSCFYDYTRMDCMCSHLCHTTKCTMKTLQSKTKQSLPKAPLPEWKIKKNTLMVVHEKQKQERLNRHPRFIHLYPPLVHFIQCVVFWPL